MTFKTDIKLITISCLSIKLLIRKLNVLLTHIHSLTHSHTHIYAHIQLHTQREKHALHDNKRQLICACNKDELIN